MKALILLLFFFVVLAAPRPVLSDTREERAVYNLCGGLNPGEICPDTPVRGKGFLQSLIDALYGLFFAKPSNIDRVYDQGSSLGAGNIPREVHDGISDEKDKLNTSLGTSWGMYGSDLPEFSDVDQEKREVEDDEKGYKKGYFPEGVDLFFEVAN